MQDNFLEVHRITERMMLDIAFDMVMLFHVVKTDLQAGFIGRDGDDRLNINDLFFEPLLLL